LACLLLATRKISLNHTSTKLLQHCFRTHNLTMLEQFLSTNQSRKDGGPNPTHGHFSYYDIMSIWKYVLTQSNDVELATYYRGRYTNKVSKQEKKLVELSTQCLSYLGQQEASSLSASKKLPVKKNDTPAQFARTRQQFLSLAIVHWTERLILATSSASSASSNDPALLIPSCKSAMQQAMGLITPANKKRDGENDDRDALLTTMVWVLRKVFTNAWDDLSTINNDSQQSMVMIRGTIVWIAALLDGNLYRFWNTRRNQPAQGNKALATALQKLVVTVQTSVSGMDDMKHWIELLGQHVASLPTPPVPIVKKRKLEAGPLKKKAKDHKKDEPKKIKAIPRYGIETLQF